MGTSANIEIFGKHFWQSLDGYPSCVIEECLTETAKKFRNTTYYKNKLLLFFFENYERGNPEIGSHYNYKITVEGGELIVEIDRAHDFWTD